MKAKVHGEHWFHVDLIAESAADHRMLLGLMKKGHFHLVCKGYGPMTKSGGVVKGESRLYLEPSIVKWQRPKEKIRRSSTNTKGDK